MEGLRAMSAVLVTVAAGLFGSMKFGQISSLHNHDVVEPFEAKRHFLSFITKSVPAKASVSQWIGFALPMGADLFGAQSFVKDPSRA
jgi:hypothetical protein